VLATRLSLRRPNALRAATALLLALAFLAVPRSVHAQVLSDIWGPGCPQGGQGGAIVTYGPTGGNWYTINDGDYKGDGLLGPCNGQTMWGWNGTSERFEWLTNAFDFLGKRCTIRAYIPTDHAGVYDARYDFWWRDTGGSWHWLAWPGHDIDQQDNSGWLQIMYPFTMPTNLDTFAITLRDDTAKDAHWRYMGAGDMSLDCNL
jgi:hypothetical protein